MTERFPEQRNRSAQRRADADQVPASAQSDAVFPADAAFPPNGAFCDDSQLVFDESFIAAAPAREPSAEARALMANRSLQLRRDGEPRPAREHLGRWSVRPSHHLAAIRLLPAVACVAGLLGAAALLFLLLR